MIAVYSSLSGSQAIASRVSLMKKIRGVEMGKKEDG